MKKLLSIIMALTMLFSTFTLIGGTASAKTLSELPTHTLTNRAYKQTLNLTADSVATVYTTAVFESNGDTWSSNLRIYDGNGVEIHEEYISSANPGTVYTFKFYLPKGTYTASIEANNDYPQYVCASIETAPTTLYGTANKVQNGKLIDYTYLSADNISYLALNEDSAVNVSFELPHRMDGTLLGLELIIKNSTGINVVDQYYYKDDETGNYTFGKTFLLAKGSYTINLKLTSGTYDINADLKTNRYKITVSSASKYTVKKPTLTQKTTKSGSMYTLSFKWADNADYDGIELWTKTNSGKWTLDKTATNGTYYRYTGVNVYYYAGNIAYYKVRAYKTGYGFKKYSAYSNVVSMKKLDKPSATVKAGTKKITVKYSAVTGATGYQVRYKLSSSKKWTTKTYSSAKSATRTIKKLKKGKKYNVQVRSFKKVGSDKMYSSWTAKKTVKVK